MCLLKFPCVGSQFCCGQPLRLKRKVLPRATTCIIWYDEHLPVINRQVGKFTFFFIRIRFANSMTLLYIGQRRVHKANRCCFTSGYSQVKDSFSTIVVWSSICLRDLISMICRSYHLCPRKKGGTSSLFGQQYTQTPPYIQQLTGGIWLNICAT